MDLLDRILTEAATDPGVRGVILTGSHARGLAGPHSDLDLTVVVAEQADPWQHRVRTARLDQTVCTVDALADTSIRWLRYRFRGARVLLDRLDGGIAALVERQAVPTAAARRLFPAVAGLARVHGHGDVLDAWGTDLDLIVAGCRDVV